MTIASLSNNTLSNYALFGLADATNRIEQSTLRLATGNRITRAGDDVAALSVATKLRSQVSSLRQALLNTSQADSFLQVAYGGLTEVSSILDRLKAISTQANSGSLSNADRAFLDTEFQTLTDEIDSIASSTNFNGIKLLDGSVTGENDVEQITTTATRGTANLLFLANPLVGQTVNLNGVTFTAGASFAVAGSIPNTIDNLVNALNQSTNTAISQATYSRSGNSLVITHDAGGAQSNLYRINQNTSTASFSTSGGATPTANLFTLEGGSNNGLYQTGVTASGTIGDTLVNGQSQTSASVTLTITGVINNGEQLRIDNGVGGNVNFTFTSAAPALPNEIQIGATTEETLQNAANVISRYTAADDYGSRQLNLRTSGNTLILTNKAPGNPLDLAGAALNISETFAAGSVSSGTFNNGTNTGINTSGVTNSAFLGEISGFTATFNSPDNVTASITVGSETYSSTITDTTPAANSFVRFNSANGGYFDVQLAGGAGLAVANQGNADTYAARLNAAFGGMNFYQSRIVSNFTAAGQLANASAEFKLDDFTDLKISGISVTQASAPGNDAIIDFDIDGETFRSASGIGGQIGAYENITLTSLDDPNRQITLRNGSNTIDLSDSTNATTYEDNLKTAFGFGTGGAGLNFQIGQNGSDQLNIQIGSALTSKLFDGQSLDVSTQVNAAAAQTVLDGAINEVQSIIAQVGSYQARLEYASGNLNSSITSVDAARGVLADTDIAYESTQFAAATVQSQAAISVLAQVNGLRSSLLDLIKVNLQ